MPKRGVANVKFSGDVYAALKKYKADNPSDWADQSKLNAEIKSIVLKERFGGLRSSSYGVVD